MPLLEIKRLSKTYPIEGGVFKRRLGSVQALKNVSLNIERGETLALVGGSGSGKSTLGRILAGLLGPDSGEILWEGRPLLTFHRQERARLLQMIFQDPYASLNPKLSVGTQLREVAPTTGRCVDLLAAVGLSSEVLSHYPFQFSGGQRQRIAIARALAMNPKLLIADEPLSALDVSIQAQILELFRKLKSELGLTMLFITHDLAVAANTAERIVVLKEGQVVEEGRTENVLNRPQHPYTQALLEAVPTISC